VHTLYETPQVITFAAILFGVALAWGFYRLLNYAVPVQRKLAASITAGFIGGSSTTIVAILESQSYGYPPLAWRIVGNILAGAFVLAVALTASFIANRRPTLASLALLLAWPLYLSSLMLVKSTAFQIEEIGVGILMSLLFGSVSASALGKEAKGAISVALGGATLLSVPLIYSLSMSSTQPFGVSHAVWLLIFGAVIGFSFTKRLYWQLSWNGLWLITLVMLWTFPLWMIITALIFGTN